MASLSVLGLAAYATSSAYTAFSAVGGTPGGRSQRNLRLSQQMPTESEQGHMGASIAGACAVGAAAAALGMTRTAKRSARVARAADMKFNEQFTHSSGPKSITVGKGGPVAFSTLAAGLAKAGLTSAIDADGPFTIFAPHDGAFVASDLTPEAVLANPDLAQILKMHVISGKIYAKDFKNQTLETLGGPVTMKKGVKGVAMNKAIIVKPDCEVANGVLHILGGVILP